MGMDSCRNGKPLCIHHNRYMEIVQIFAIAAVPLVYLLLRAFLEVMGEPCRIMLGEPESKPSAGEPSTAAAQCISWPPVTFTAWPVM